LEQQMNLVST
jgi:hypothetical protein